MPMPERGMRDGRAEMMATQAQLCAVSAVARHSAAARVNKTASRGRTHLHWIDGPRTRAAGRLQSCDGVRIAGGPFSTRPWASSLLWCVPNDV